MKSILVQMNCKYCYYQSHKQSETYILPEFEPDLKDMLMKETFFTAHCPQCGAKIEYLHTCIYADKKLKFVLFIKSEKERKEADHQLYEDGVYTKRYMKDVHTIPEKIRILESKLDDRVIEILKVKLILRAKHLHKPITSIRYQDYDSKTKTIWFQVCYEEMEDVLAITIDSYEKIRKTLPSIRSARFEEIDISWAIEYLKQREER